MFLMMVFQVFWDTEPCNVETDRRFRGWYFLDYNVSFNHSARRTISEQGLFFSDLTYFLSVLVVKCATRTTIIISLTLYVRVVARSWR
jgi:hypothetical protein